MGFMITRINMTKTYSSNRWLLDDTMDDLLQNNLEILYIFTAYWCLKKAPTSHRMKLRSLLQDFANVTTMHGMPKVISAKGNIHRTFWSIVCFLAALMFSLQLALLIQKYLTYPKKVEIEIMPAAVPFPAISLCNMRSLDVMVLNTFNKIFLSNSLPPLIWNRTVVPRFVNKYMETVSRYYPMYLREDLDLKIFQTVLTRNLIASNIDSRTVASAGVSFNEFIVTCLYGNKDCNRTADFTQFFDSYYYNCFTFRAPPTPSGDGIQAEGLANGWSTIVLAGSGMLQKNKDVRAIPGTYDRFSPMSSNDGVRVVIHPPDTEPYPHTEGFDVPPGYSSTFGVKAQLNQRIGPPHGNGTDQDPFAIKHGHRYRTSACQKSCLQQHIVQKCGCKDISLPGASMFTDVKYCMDDKEVKMTCTKEATDDCIAGLHAVHDRVMCVRNVSASVTSNMRLIQQCKCVPSCKEVSYDVSYSLCKWPSSSFEGDAIYVDIFHMDDYIGRLASDNKAYYNKTALYTQFFSPANRIEAMENFARINVYIADNNIIKIVESPDYPVSQFLSDIGGQLGLWTGVSVITLVEVMELFVAIAEKLWRTSTPDSRSYSDKNAQEEFKHGMLDDPCQTLSSSNENHARENHCLDNNSSYGNPWRRRNSEGSPSRFEEIPYLMRSRANIREIAVWHMTRTGNVSYIVLYQKSFTFYLIYFVRIFMNMHFI